MSLANMTATPHASRLLTDEQVETYNRQGFVVPDFRLSREETSRLRGLITRLVDENPRWAAHLSSPHVPGSGLRKFKGFSGWEEFYAHPAILDMIEQLVGPDIILWGTSHFFKRAVTGYPTPWHRDSFDSPIKPFVSPLVWIAATDATKSSGCLRFIPGSNHDASPGTHEDLVTPDNVAIKLVDEFDEASAVDVEIEAGQMIIFDAHTIHSSNEAKEAERASFTLRYMPATSLYDHDSVSQILRDNYHGFHTRPLILVRGADRAGNDFKRGHPGLDPQVELQKVD